MSEALEEMAGIIFGDTSKLTKEHQADLIALDEVHTKLVEEYEKLEQQNESLYQNQQSIIETNNVLIKRLKEAEEVIKWYSIDTDGGVYAKDYLNKYIDVTED